MNNNKIPVVFEEGLRCPRCHQGKLLQIDSVFRCSSSNCGPDYPIVDQCPVLINENNSIFRLSDFESRQLTTMDLREAGSKTRSVLGYLSDALEAVTPTVSRSVGDFNAKAAIDEIARASSEPPRILVIGAGDAQFDVDTESHLLYSDVAMGRMTHLICDAHDLAFEDGFFDAVVAVAVLEHVADPYRCVAEIQRVLRPGGYVYAVTPFMQQVHLGRYDFTRFTYLGHRRLFRWFKERRSGVANGPGMAMAWSVERFFLAIGNGKVSRQLLSTLARWLTFPALYLDKWLAKKPIAYDASSAYYFFGEKADTPISDREIVALYKGAGH